MARLRPRPGGLRIKHRLEDGVDVTEQCLGGLVERDAATEDPGDHGIRGAERIGEDAVIKEPVQLVEHAPKPDQPLSDFPLEDLEQIAVVVRPNLDHNRGEGAEYLRGWRLLSDERRRRRQQFGRLQGASPPGNAQVVDGREQDHRRIGAPCLQPVQVIWQLDQCQHQGLSSLVAIWHAACRQPFQQALHFLSEARRSSQIECGQHSSHLIECGNSLTAILLTATGDKGL